MNHYIVKRRVEAIVAQKRAGMKWKQKRIP